MILKIEKFLFIFTTTDHCPF